MKLLTPVAFVAATLLPHVALACPSGAGACGGSMGYASTFGVGIAAGILSILFERSFGKKR